MLWKSSMSMSIIKCQFYGNQKPLAIWGQKMDTSGCALKNEVNGKDPRVRSQNTTVVA